VAPTPVGRGFARMFQTLHDHPPIQIEIFDSESQAVSWLNG
jgi:hypothetical protein